MIIYKLGKDGSFVAGDTETTLTSYAYPTSEHAVNAKKNPLKVSNEMIQAEKSCLLHRGDYDVNNWAKLR